VGVERLSYRDRTALRLHPRIKFPGIKLTTADAKSVGIPLWLRKEKSMTDEQMENLAKKTLERELPHAPDLYRFRSDSMGDPSGCVGWTYRRLKGFLETLTDVQLNQPVQVFGPETEVPGPETEDCSTPIRFKPIRLKPVYAAGTVEQMCHGKDGEILQETIGPNFAHHPEQVIILIDYSPFGPEGDTSYELLDDGTLKGNVSGKEYKFGKVYDPSKSQGGRCYSG
jgi:hypothetical protein